MPRKDADCYALLVTHTASPASTSNIPKRVCSGRSTLSPSTAAVAAVNTSESALHTGTAEDISGGRNRGAFRDKGLLPQRRVTGEVG